MDFVGELQTGLELQENAARGLAGQVLGLIEDVVREKVSFGVAGRLRAAVPEMTQWQLAAPTIRPGSLSLDSLPVAPLDEHAEFHGLLERFRVDVKDAGRVNALALRFLSSRLEPTVVAQIARAWPVTS